jgi:hypothetical protein
METSSVAEEIVETDDQIIDRIRKRFRMMDKLAEAVTEGAIKSLIVTGAPGVGKSFGVEQLLDRKKKIADFPYEIIKGHMSAVVLYKKLYQYRHTKNILVFDDCDSVLLDANSLNLFKAALDSSDRRFINWGTLSRELEKENIPTSFEYSGSVIFISNLNFEKEKKSTELREHFNALQSRSHFLDLTISSLKERMLRIKQVVCDTPILSGRFEQNQIEEIIGFVGQNLTSFREISLRLITKISDLYCFDEKGWKEIAETTLFKNK